MQSFFDKTSRYCYFLLLAFIFSCSNSNRNEQGYRDVQSQNPAQYQQKQPVPTRVTPDYYYHQPYVAQPAYQQQPYRGYPQQPAPQYGYPPASRSYNNPYSFQPVSQYPNYDVDHYYVPPASYNGYEEPPSNSFHESIPQNNR